MSREEGVDVLLPTVSFVRLLFGSFRLRWSTTECHDDNVDRHQLPSQTTKQTVTKVKVRQRLVIKSRDGTSRSV